MSKVKASTAASTTDDVAQDSDERQADTGRDEQVELEHEPPSTTGAVYEGSVIVEESKRPMVSS